MADKTWGLKCSLGLIIKAAGQARSASLSYIRPRTFSSQLYNFYLSPGNAFVVPRDSLTVVNSKKLPQGVNNQVWNNYTSSAYPGLIIQTSTTAEKKLGEFTLWPNSRGLPAECSRFADPKCFESKSTCTSLRLQFSQLHVVRTGNTEAPWIKAESCSSQILFSNSRCR